MLQNFLLIFLGGGLGSSLRYLAQVIFAPRVTVLTAFPWTTFVINVLGSLMIGLFYSLSVRMRFSDDVRLFLTSGLCGGFTTFSTFSNETFALVRSGSTLTAVCYVVLSVLAAVAGVYAGMLMARNP